MKTIFRLKYKLHRFINILFYLIFFILGYLLGQGGEIFEKVFDIIRSMFN